MRDKSLILSDSSVRAVISGSTKYAIPVRNRIFHNGYLFGEGSDFATFRHCRDLSPNDLLMETKDGYIAQHVGWEKYASYQVGDIIWVREAFADIAPSRLSTNLVYRADTDGERVRVDAPWKPSSQMKRKYSRITLRVTDVTVKRTGDVTQSEAQAMGYTTQTLAGKSYQIRDQKGNITEGTYAWTSEDWAFRTIWHEKYAVHDVSPQWLWLLTFQRVDLQ